MTSPCLDLDPHTKRTHLGGRSLGRQVLWPAVSRLFFQQWWFPARLRPALLRAFGARVDDDVVIRECVRVARPWRVRIEGPAWIAHGAQITNGADITIERDVCLSRDASLGLRSHETGTASTPTAGSIVLRRGAWVCARATVLPGTEVDAHAVVLPSPVG